MTQYTNPTGPRERTGWVHIGDEQYVRRDVVMAALKKHIEALQNQADAESKPLAPVVFYGPVIDAIERGENPFALDYKRPWVEGETS